ncbi:hypothetical protein PMAC_001072 [Pneumocystis sp. 'macacae']|nr:hypothetical protein PMAC_001072 [Pneumocystis sp. 'macacae']
MPLFNVNLKRYFYKTAVYIPRIIVYGLLSWSLWVYIWIVCIQTVPIFFSIILIFFVIIGFGFCCWCYTATSFTFPGSPQNNNGYIHIAPYNYSAFISVKQNGSPRFCNKCEALKPDRTHHCSICNRCVLKMDHHCPWFSNCIGFANYKHFFLFLIYISIYSFYLFISSLIILYKFVIIFDGTSKKISVNWILLLVISGVFAITLGGFTIWHFFLVFRNLTTIEALKQTHYITNRLNYNNTFESKIDIGNAFDLGWKKNWNQVMGSNKILWFLPISKHLGTGESYPINHDVARKLYEYQQKTYRDV